jgi:hypothetical protein
MNASLWFSDHPIFNLLSAIADARPSGGQLDTRLMRFSANGGFVISRSGHLIPSAAYELAEKHCEAVGKVAVFNTFPKGRKVEFRCGSRKKWIRRN